MEKRAPLLLLSVTYVDVDTVTGRLNENLPKVTNKLVPQSKPNSDKKQYGNWLIMLPLPLGGRGGEGKV